MPIIIPPEPECKMSHKDEIKYLRRIIMCGYDDMRSFHDLKNSETEESVLFSNNVIALTDVVISIITGLVDYEGNSLDKFSGLPSALNNPPYVRESSSITVYCRRLKSEITRATSSWLQLNLKVNFIVSQLQSGVLLTDPSVTEVFKEANTLIELLDNSYQVKDHILSRFHSYHIAKKNKDYVHVYKEVYTTHYHNTVYPDLGKDFYLIVVACIIKPSLYGTLFSAHPELSRRFCCLPDHLIEAEFINCASQWKYNLKYTSHHHALVNPSVRTKIELFMTEPHYRQSLMRAVRRYRKSLLLIDN